MVVTKYRIIVLVKDSIKLPYWATPFRKNNIKFIQLGLRVSKLDESDSRLFWINADRRGAFKYFVVSYDGVWKDGFSSVRLSLNTR